MTRKDYVAIARAISQAASHRAQAPIYAEGWHAACSSITHRIAHRLCASAWAEYERVCAPAWAEYERVRAPARAEYDRLCASAWAEYDRLCASTRAEFERIRASTFGELYSGV